MSPNAEGDVISRAIELDCVPVPGIATATGAFSAYAYGARFLKLFPARTYGPAHIKDLRAVLPGDDIDTVRSNATTVNEAVVAVNRKNEGKCFESKHT